MSNGIGTVTITEGFVCCDHTNGRNSCGQVHGDWREASLCMKRLHLTITDPNDERWERSVMRGAVIDDGTTKHLVWRPETCGDYAAGNAQWLRDRGLDDSNTDDSDAEVRAWTRRVVAALERDLAVRSPVPPRVTTFTAVQLAASRSSSTAKKTAPARRRTSRASAA